MCLLHYLDTQYIASLLRYYLFSVEDIFFSSMADFVILSGRLSFLQWRILESPLRNLLSSREEQDNSSLQQTWHYVLCKYISCLFASVGVCQIGFASLLSIIFFS